MGRQGGRYLVLGDYPVLEETFLKKVRSIREAEPFQPLLIFVSSKLLGLHLRRLLVERGQPHFNLRFLTLEEFAREVSGPVLTRQGKRELPPFGDELLIGTIVKRLASEDESFYFRDIADRHGFHRALLAAFKDLKDACLRPEEMERFLSETPQTRQVHFPKLRDLTRLYKAYWERLEEIGAYDASDLTVSSPLWARNSFLLKETPALLAYGFYDFNEAQRRLLQACFEAKETTFFFPFEPTSAFAFAGQALKWLRERGFEEIETATPPPPVRPAVLEHLCLSLFGERRPLEEETGAVEIISAPGEVREVREIVRRILRAWKEEKIPSHEIGILLRTPEVYSPLLREAFESVGIEPYLREGIPLSETRAGRSLLLFLKVVAEDFSRQSVMEFATFAPLRMAQTADGDPLLNLSRWDDLSRQASILEGQGEWEPRLQRLRVAYSQRLNNEEEGERGRLRGDLLCLDNLIRFVRELSRAARRLTEEGTWKGKVDALLDLFQTLIEEDQTAPHIRQALFSLAGLDLLAPPASSREFIRLVSEALERSSVPLGRFQRNGPIIAHLMALRGVPFKMVIVPGLVEKSFPPVVRQDAILLDQERRALNRWASGRENGPLPLKAEGRLEEERLLFRLAIGAARERVVLSYPRIEPGTGKERLPSSFMLRTIEALTGRGVDFNQVESYPHFYRVPLSEVAVKNPEEALDEAEYDLSFCLERLGTGRAGGVLYLKTISNHFEKGLKLERSRWGERSFTEFDGLLASEEALQSLRDVFPILERRISPTHLETYASCPFQYFLREVMGIEALVEPEKVVTISPPDRGRLIHEILYEFYTDLKKERGAPIRLKREDLDRLIQKAQEKMAWFEEVGLTGYPILWEMEKRQVLEQLEAFFQRELEEREFFPTYFEVRYGMRPRGEREGLYFEEPLCLELKGRVLKLIGRIDRIDLTRDGNRGRVIDYKTGQVRGKKNEFQGGKNLQLPLYLFAAKNFLSSLHPGLEIESAQYRSLKEEKSISFEGSALVEKEVELMEILDTLVSGIEGGIFISLPDHQGCRHRLCDYRTICGPWARTLFERKLSDPRVRRLLEVLEVIEGRSEGEEA
ncbi:MAG: exodeoxyribonuclease V subunit gamma [Desulfobacterota bacterium]|nr:exodeoxyribonuclease V subunit gamma [Thermodesulfobacteriota bacterium]